jgi:hypothetical protein
MSTRVYLDTSAAAKLFIVERETSDLRQWLSDLPEPHLVSSALLAVELLRLLRLLNPATVTPAEQFLAADVDIVEVTPPVLGDATTVPPERLRTLDAIHLARVGPRRLRGRPSHLRQAPHPGRPRHRPHGGVPGRVVMILDMGRYTLSL